MHEITIGKDPQASAEILASLIRQDIKTDTAEPLKPGVKYVEPKGKSPWQSPAEVNAAGEAPCGGLTRAAAPHVDASHVGVIQVPQSDGSVAHHSFAVKDAAPGEAPIAIGGDGKALTPIPPERIHDESVLRNMPGGALPLEAYQSAHFAPIHPPHLDDLSHVHAPAADRAAEGRSYQGAERLHTPTTDAGATVAAVSQWAARVVPPPAAHVPRPLEELYPGHPMLSAIGEGEDAIKRVVGWPTSKRMALAYHDGLSQIAAGVNPAPLDSDAPIGPEHIAAAQALKTHVETLVGAATGRPEYAAKLADVASSLASADRSEPEHDAAAAVVAEVDAMLPGATPHHVLQPLAFYAPPFGYAESLDRGGYGETEGLALALSVALGSVSAGHPEDGQRPPRPPRRSTADPRMGAPASPAPSGGGRGGVGGGPPTATAPPAISSASPPPALPPGPGPSGDGGAGEEGGGWESPRFGRHREGRDRSSPWREGGGFVEVDDDEEDEDGEEDGSMVISRRVISEGVPGVVEVPVPVASPPRVIVERVPVPVEVPQPESMVDLEPVVGDWLPRFGRRPVHGYRPRTRTIVGRPSHPIAGKPTPGHPGHHGGPMPLQTAQAGTFRVGQHGTLQRNASGTGPNGPGYLAAGSSVTVEHASGPDLRVMARTGSQPPATWTIPSDTPITWTGGNAGTSNFTDPSLRGWGDWSGSGWGWGHRDRYVAGPVDASLRRAVWAYQHDPWSRRRLEGGHAVYGHGLGAVRAALGLDAASYAPAYTDPLLDAAPLDEDPPLMGRGHDGHAWGGRGSWSPWSAPVVVAVADSDEDDDPPTATGRGFRAPAPAPGCGC